MTFIEIHHLCTGITNTAPQSTVRETSATRGIYEAEKKGNVKKGYLDCSNLAAGKKRCLGKGNSPITQGGFLKANLEPLLYVLHFLYLLGIEALEADLVVYLTRRRQIRRVSDIKNGYLPLLDNARG